MNNFLKKQGQQGKTKMKGKPPSQLYREVGSGFRKSPISRLFAIWHLLILGLLAWWLVPTGTAIYEQIVRIQDIKRLNEVSKRLKAQDIKLQSNTVTQLTDGKDWSTYSSVTLKLQHLDYEQSKMTCFVEVSIPREVLKYLVDVEKKSPVFQDMSVAQLHVIPKPEYENLTLHLQIGSITIKHGTFKQITLKQISENYDVVSGKSIISFENEFLTSCNSGGYPFDMSFFETKLSLSCTGAAFFDMQKKMALHSIPFNLYVIGLSDESKESIASIGSYIVDDRETHLLTVMTTRVSNGKWYPILVISQVVILIFFLSGYLNVRNKENVVTSRRSYFLSLLSGSLIFLSFRTVLIPEEIKTFTLVDYVFGLLFSIILIILIILPLCQTNFKPGVPP